MNTVTKPWGREDILLSEPSYKVKRITVNPGHEISLQRHNKREEHWVVVQGIGVCWKPDYAYGTPSKEVVRPKILEQGHRAYIGLNETHKIQCAGVTPLVIIEVQRGQCDDEDIVRLEDPYDRDEHGLTGRN